MSHGRLLRCNRSTTRWNGDECESSDRSGYAVRCAEGLRPSKSRCPSSSGCARQGGRSPTRQKTDFPVGQSRHRTSSGKATTDESYKQFVIILTTFTNDCDLCDCHKH